MIRVLTIPTVYVVEDTRDNLAMKLDIPVTVGFPVIKSGT
jgi:hypothetical protein